MALSAREQRVLTAIERDLATAEPQLARALSRARLPVLRCRLLTERSSRKRGSGPWIAGMIASLLYGIAVLTIGLVMGNAVLIWAGALTAQFSPVVVGFLGGRSRGKSR